MGDKEYIKIGVILDYGKDNAKKVAEILNAENGEEKISSFRKTLLLKITTEQKIFIIQKLLSYPKSVRKSIAEQILKRLSDEPK